MGESTKQLNALLVPVGTPGDVQPFVDLGLALRARGHRVTLIVNSYFEEAAQRNGFEFASSGRAEDFRRLIIDKSLWNPAKAHRVFARKLVLPELAAQYKATADRYEPGRTVVAAQTMALGARIAQEKLGVPLASVHRQPMVLRSLYRSSCAPFMILPDWLPRPAKAIQFAILDKILDRPFETGLDEARGRLGLPPVRRIAKNWIHSPRRLLCFWPEWFGQVQPDWPTHIRLLGFIARETGEREPDDSLRKFLADGEPPIVITFGSGVTRAAPLYAAAAQACAILGRRGILATRYADQVPASLPADVIHTSYAPFSWLLPKAAAIVHHGGIGTVGQSLAAGVPQLVVPGLVFDTFDNARRLERLGVARSIRLSRCNAARMAHALNSLFKEATYAARAKELAQAVHAVDAIGSACQELERLAG